MGTSGSLKEACLRPAVAARLMLVATRKKSWRLDGHKLDRQRDWLGVSEKKSSSTARGMRPSASQRRFCLASVEDPNSSSMMTH